MSAPLDLDAFEGFTPGPWFIRQINDGTLDIEFSDGHLRSRICRSHVETLCSEHGSVAGNLRLIAAAPALLAECRRQREVLREQSEQIARLWRITHQINNDLEDGHADYAFAIVQQVIHKEEAARAALASCERSEPAASEGEGA